MEEEQFILASQKKRNLRLLIVLGALLVLLVGFFGVFSMFSTTEEMPSWIPPKKPPKPLTHIQVFSEPSNAKVFLEDGMVSLTKTPGVVSLLPGNYTLRFEIPGLSVQKVSVDTKEQKEIRVSWDAIVVKLGATVPKVTLFLDGTALGFTPIVIHFPRGEESHEVKAVWDSTGQEKSFSFKTTGNIKHLFDFDSPETLPKNAP